MKPSKREQVTVPKQAQDRVEPTPKKLEFHKWKGKCKRSFAELGYTSVDEYIEDVRGR